MKKTLIAVALLLLPAMAMAQQKYTNADLDIPPKRDAYTNADLKGLAPLPVSGGAADLAEIPAAPVDRGAEAVAQRKADLQFDRDMMTSEIAYWEAVIKQAFSGKGGINDYPRIGKNTAEARLRITHLQRHIDLVDEEMSRLR